MIEIQVKEVPESIRMEVYETGILGDMLVGEILVPIPGPTETLSSLDRETTEIDFSGRPFSNQINQKIGTSSSNESGESWYSGKIKMSCVWGIDENGRSLGPRKM